MPNRILRDWTDSAPVDKLTWQEEVLFTRLIMKADDFGNFYRNSSLVKSLLFPRKDGLRTSDIDRWLLNIEAAGLIRCYSAKGDTFLHIANFGQRLDRTARKFPKEPDSIDDNQPPHIAADGFKPPPETKRNEVETETEEESAEAHTPEQKILFEKFQFWIKDNAPRVNQLKQPITIDEFIKLKQKLSNEVVKNLLIAMHNYKPLLTKSVSAYLTILNWAKRETSNGSNTQTIQQPTINDALKAAKAS